MYCRKCGAEVADGSRFCRECGTPTTEENKAVPVRKRTYKKYLLIVGIPVMLMILAAGWLVFGMKIFSKQNFIGTISYSHEWMKKELFFRIVSDGKTMTVREMDKIWEGPITRKKDSTDGRDFIYTVKIKKAKDADGEMKPVEMAVRIPKEMEEGRLTEGTLGYQLDGSGQSYGCVITLENDGSGMFFSGAVNGEGESSSAKLDAVGQQITDEGLICNWETASEMQWRVRIDGFEPSKLIELDIGDEKVGRNEETILPKVDNLLQKPFVGKMSYYPEMMSSDVALSIESDGENMTVIEGKVVYKGKIAEKAVSDNGKDVVYTLEDMTMTVSASESEPPGIFLVRVPKKAGNGQIEGTWGFGYAASYVNKTGTDMLERMSFSTYTFKDDGISVRASGMLDGLPAGHDNDNQIYTCMSGELGDSEYVKGLFETEDDGTGIQRMCGVSETPWKELSQGFWEIGADQDEIIYNMSLELE